MHETLQNFNITIFIGGRPICNLRFEDDIDLMGGNKNELQDLTTRLKKGKSLWDGRRREKQSTCPQYQPEHPH